MLDTKFSASSQEIPGYFTNDIAIISSTLKKGLSPVWKAVGSLYLKITPVPVRPRGEKYLP